MKYRKEHRGFKEAVMEGTLRADNLIECREREFGVELNSTHGKELQAREMSHVDFESFFNVDIVK